MAAPQDQKQSMLSRSTRWSDASIHSLSFFNKKRERRASSLGNMSGVRSTNEAHFVLLIGLLLSLNAGYINGLCLSGILSEGGSRQQGVSAFTGTYTKSGLALGNGEVKLFGFEISLILSFIFGAMISGAMNPKAVPHRLAPSYGPNFVLGSVCMIVSAIMGDLDPHGRTLYYFAAIAMGIQNGMTSLYSANLIRTTHLTGTSTDIGLILGQVLRGERKNLWKLKVLVGLATSFWLGSFISFYSASKFLSRSLWFSVALFLAIGLAHLTFIVLTQKVSFVQAVFGRWKWHQVLEHMASSLNDGGGSPALSELKPEQIDSVFDLIDRDNSGEIDADELKEALAEMGMKTLTRKNVEAMISVVDENGDGVVDRDEFHTLVSIAALRAAHKQETKKKRRETLQQLRSSLTLSRGSNDAEPSDQNVNEESITLQGQTLIDRADLRRRLPRTYEEAVSMDKATSDEPTPAIIVTESTPPFCIVAVNEEWSDLCGYEEEEAISKSMSSLIQGPKTNRKGLKKAIADLDGGNDYVECETVNYRKDGSMFRNHLIMGPLYDSVGTDEEEKGEPTYYVGILLNLGDLAQDMTIEGVKKDRESRRVSFK